MGSLTLGLTSNSGGNGNGGPACPAAQQLTYLVAPKKPEPASNGSEGSADGEEKKSVEVRLAEALRDAHVKLLKELSCDSEEERQAYSELQAQLLASHPTHLPLLLERLQRAQKAANASAGTAAGEAQPTDAAGSAAAGADSAADSAGGSSGTNSAASREAGLQAVVAAADGVIGAIDTIPLAIYQAQKCPEEGPGAAKRKKGEPRGGRKEGRDRE